MKTQRLIVGNKPKLVFATVVFLLISVECIALNKTTERDSTTSIVAYRTRYYDVKHKSSRSRMRAVKKYHRRNTIHKKRVVVLSPEHPAVKEGQLTPKSMMSPVYRGKP